MRRSRRNALILLGGGALVASGYVLNRGIRYVPPQFIPEEAAMSSGDPRQNGFQATAQGAIFQQRDNDQFQFRAFVPEPEISITGQPKENWVVVMDNVHPGAKLESSDTTVSESIQNLTRVVSGNDSDAELKWRFPKQDKYRFAAIGDTGGGTELRWVLRRAQELGADFILHLGDLNYAQGDYMGAVEAFTEINIPTFVTIGNHDFYEALESVHPLFRRYIGPRNAVFELGGVRFLNMDTAGGFIPPSAGYRGDFLGGLEPSDGLKENVVFTHKPLFDPREGEGLSVSSPEYSYLHDEFTRLGVDTLLAGHIHIKEELDDQGIRTIISGQGLAHADLIVDHPIAEILLGDVTPEADGVHYHWAPLLMPFEAHCSPRAWEVLVEIEKPGVLRQLKEICTSG